MNQLNPAHRETYDVTDVISFEMAFKMIECDERRQQKNNIVFVPNVQGFPEELTVSKDPPYNLHNDLNLFQGFAITPDDAWLHCVRTVLDRAIDGEEEESAKVSCTREPPPLEPTEDTIY